MDSRDFGKGALLGVIAGVLGGILFAPKSGEETREDIKTTFNDIKDNVIEKLQVAGEFTREKYEEIVGTVVSGYKEAKKITPEESERIREILSESFDKIQEAISKGSRDIRNETKDISDEMK